MKKLPSHPTSSNLTNYVDRKPTKIKLPHSFLDFSKLRICLITRDDTNKGLDTLLNHSSFPARLRTQLARIISFSSLRGKYKSYESLRQLHGEYDIFLADDRIYNLLPRILGKIFYKSTAKRPIPVIVSGKPEIEKEKPEEDEAIAKLRKRQPKPPTVASPEFLAAELEKALESTMVWIGNSPTTQIKISKAGMPVTDMAENARVVAEAVVEKLVPNQWKGLRSLHIKGQHTVSLPLWMAEELWVDESKILQESKENEKHDAIEGEQEQPATGAVEEAKSSRKRKAGAGDAEEASSKKTKSAEDKKAKSVEAKKESAARKEKLKKLKAQSLAEADGKTAKLPAQSRVRGVIIADPRG
jgi:ribosome biogenesis protein UTP30